MRRITLQLCSFLLAFALLGMLPSMAMENWEKEFNAVCGKTHNAFSFSTDELTELIARCDALKPRIEKLDASQDTQRKVFLQRLKRCRDFYAFALDAKDGKNPK